MYGNNMNIIPMLSVLYKRTQAIAIFAYAFVLKISVIGSDGLNATMLLSWSFYI